MRNWNKKTLVITDWQSQTSGVKLYIKIYLKAEKQGLVDNLGFILGIKIPDKLKSWWN